MSGYSLAVYAAADAEARRLEAQAALIRRIEVPHYSRAGLWGAQRILDVGAGTGAPAQVLRSFGPEVVGVDLDANALSRMSGQRARAGVHQLPFPSGAFDASYARLVLQHVPDPTAALREMSRVVAPGGLVLVVDTDVSGFVSDPVLPTVAEGRRRWMERTRARGAMPDIGRHLSERMQEAGLESVEVHCTMVTSFRLGRDTFGRMLLDTHYRADPDPEFVRRGSREIEQWLASSRSFGSAPLFIAWGRVP